MSTTPSAAQLATVTAPTPVPGAVAGPLFRCMDAQVRYGAVVALQGVRLQIHPGERVALVGANGCGKSSLLRLLHGLVPPASGRMTADPAARQAMLFQRPHMLRARVLTNVALGLFVQGTPWSEAKARGHAALKRVRLDDLADRQARGLSGGQQQRLALARAWSLRPDVLLLDEPTASLDPYAKQEVEALLAELADEGITLVFASHNLGQVKRLASRVVYIERGRVLADLPVGQFFDRTLLGATSHEAEAFVRGELV